MRVKGRLVSARLGGRLGEVGLGREKLAGEVGEELELGCSYTNLILKLI